MKTCSLCEVSKDVDLFVKQKRSSDGLFPWCKDCQLTYTNNWRISRLKWLQNLKSNTPCIDCGQIYEPYCMDYDHISERGQKNKSITKMILDNTPQKIILEEIKKCELVCVICHKIRTNNRFNEILGLNRKYPSHVQRNINIINEFKNKPCVICCQLYDLFNMELDHVDSSTKLYNVCQLKSRKLKILNTELAKCQVLCALCHRRKSIIEQQDNKYSTPRVKPTKRRELFYDPATNTKECGRCHQIKNGKLFKTNKNMMSGLNTYCRECSNKHERERKANQ